MYYTVTGSCYTITKIKGSWTRTSSYADVGATATVSWYGESCADGSAVAINNQYDLTPASWTNNAASRTKTLSLPTIQLNFAGFDDGAKLDGTELYRNRYVESLCSRVTFNNGAGCN
jgi:hypothetical protein